mmetsp:Transcript_14691/g.16989  ORF Transcript_14691/g.16989 Transcript_14691/m.16989 type:complete len:84 (+) Transcript_14691:279-530(+)
MEVHLSQEDLWIVCKLARSISQKHLDVYFKQKRQVNNAQAATGNPDDVVVQPIVEQFELFEQEQEEEEAKQCRMIEEYAIESA